MIVAETTSSVSMRIDGLLLVLVGALAISGVFVYPPGSDVSAYAFSQSAVAAPIVVFGQTALAWCSLCLLVVAGCVGLLRQRRLPRSLWWALALAVTYLVARSVLSLTAGGGEMDATARLALPLLLFAALFASAGRTTVAFERFLVLVNVGLVGQVLLCRLATGTFGANRYYIELTEEFFGYYYHPFAFSGALAVLSVYATSKALARERRGLWLTLLVCNFYLIWNTQVRTFLVAATLGMVTLAIQHAFAKGKPLVLAGLVSAAMMLLVVWTPDLISRDRSVSDVSSGRLARWAGDLGGFADRGSDLEVLFGMGPGSIYELNARLFGVRINSLNLAVDTLIDFGVVGVLIMAVCWSLVLSSAKASAPVGMVGALTVFFVTTAMLTSMIDFPLVASLFVVVACSRAGSP